MYITPLVELVVRYIYFGLHFNELTVINKRKRKRSIKKIWIKNIEEKMKQFGIKKGDTIMVHSSFKYVDDTVENFIDFLKGYIGEEGNILMPTHPQLHDENGNQVYDIDKSPSTMGYLTEVFRKSEGVKRSKHPFSSVAVWGKDSSFLLEGNLNNNKPLPHGVFSPYYKMTELGGKVLCIGVSAKGRATIKHVAEEVLDHKYPTKNLFKDEEVIIKKDGIFIEKAKVRLLDLKKSQIFVAKSKIEKEWLNNRILIKDTIENVPFEKVDSRLCINYMINEAKRGNTNYPFAPQNHNKII